MFQCNKYVLFALACCAVTSTSAAASSPSVERYERCNTLPWRDQEQQYLLRHQQLTRYVEAMGLLRQGDFVTAQRALLFSLEKMKASCDINQYELADELRALTWLMEKDKRYAQAQQLYENALPLAGHHSFEKSFLTSATKYAWLAEKPDDALRLFKQMTFGEAGEKLPPVLWHLDEKNHQLFWRVANMYYPLSHSREWLLVDVDPAPNRGYTTQITYLLYPGGKIHFSGKYIEEDTNNAMPLPGQEKETTPTMDSQRLPDFPVEKSQQRKTLKKEQQDLVARWEIRQGDWLMNIKAEFYESENQAALKSIADLFTHIKWENPPKLYQQQTMQSIINELYPLWLSPNNAPVENWNKARLIASKGLQIAAYPAEYQKFYTIMGIADYRNGRYAEAWQTLEKARAQLPYTRDGWNDKEILLYAALSAMRCGHEKEGYERLAEYIQAAEVIGASGRWQVDTARRAITETRDRGLSFPLLTARTMIEYAGEDLLLYSFNDSAESYFVAILPPGTPPKAYILQRLKVAKEQTKEIQFRRTERIIPGSQDKVTRWAFKKSEALSNDTSPDEGVYWIIPWQGKTLVVFARTYDRQIADAEKGDGFVGELLAAPVRAGQ